MIILRRLESIRSGVRHGTKGVNILSLTPFLIRRGELKGRRLHTKVDINGTCLFLQTSVPLRRSANLDRRGRICSRFSSFFRVCPLNHQVSFYFLQKVCLSTTSHHWKRLKSVLVGGRILESGNGGTTVRRSDGRCLGRPRSGCCVRSPVRRGILFRREGSVTVPFCSDEEA